MKVHEMSDRRTAKFDAKREKRNTAMADFAMTDFAVPLL